MTGKKTAFEKEWRRLLRREERLIRGMSARREPFLDRKLRAVVPDGLQQKLESAFYRAFRLILEQGTGAIEKTYSRERLDAEYRTREFAARLYPERRNLSAGRRAAARRQAAGVAGACAEGAALGVLGIGLPDIPLFLAVLLRSLYAQALQFGIDYRRPEETEFLLDLIALSLSPGEDFAARDAALNRQIYRMEQDAAVNRRNDRTEQDAALNRQICRTKQEAGAGCGSGRTEAAEGFGTAEAAPEAGGVSEETIRRAARSLSGELLYMKFLQGIPVAGILGGIYDGIYLKRITDYALLKMERRWLLRQEQDAAARRRI